MFTLINVFTSGAPEELNECAIAHFRRAKDAKKAFCRELKRLHMTDENGNLVNCSHSSLFNVEGLFDDMLSQGYALHSFEGSGHELLFVRREKVRDSLADHEEIYL